MSANSLPPSPARLAVHAAFALMPFLAIPAGAVQPGEDRHFTVAVGDSAEGQEFGRALSISGPRMAVGAPGYGVRGAVFVYRRGEGHQWGQVDRIDGPPGTLRFGETVSLDGERLAVGAPASDFSELTSEGTTVHVGAGRAFVYRGEPETAGEGWALESELYPAEPAGGARFGESLALSGGNVLVAAPDHGAGKVTAFAWTGGAPAWQRAGTLEPTDPEVARFGRSVDAHGDRAIVGAAHASETGVALLYEREPAGGGAWSLAQTFARPDGDLESEGWAHRVRIDGGLLAVGSFRGPRAGNEGSVYLYRASPTGWDQELRIDPPSPGDRFANDFDLSGDQLAIGSPLFGNSGSVFRYAFGYVPSLGKNGWHSLPPLALGTGIQPAAFGAAVAVGGGLTAGGAPGAANDFFGGVGEVVLALNATFPEWGELAEAPGDEFGAALDFDGARAVVGAPGAREVKVYEHAPGVAPQWIGTLSPPAGSDPADRFGAAVAVEGPLVLVGAPGANNDTGAAWIFEQTGTGPGGTPVWTRRDLTGATVGGDSRFGAAVALNRGQAFIGAPGATASKKIGGLWFLMIEVGLVAIHDADTGGPNAWGRRQTLRHGQPEGGQRFGYSLDASGDYLAIGAPSIAPQHSPASVWVYHNTDPAADWDLLRSRDAIATEPPGLLGTAVAIGADGLAAYGDRAFTAGLVYFYQERLDPLPPPALGALFSLDPATPGQFGASLAIDNGRVLIGHPDDGNPEFGKAYLFTAPPTEEGYYHALDHWRIDELNPSLRLGDGANGTAAALAAGVALVGQPGLGSGGAVNGYELDGSSFAEWQAYHYPGQIAPGRADDTDGDGRAEVFEWLAGTDPHATDVGPPITIRHAPGGGSLLVEFTAPAWPSRGAGPQLDQSTDLQKWFPAAWADAGGSWWGAQTLTAPSASPGHRRVSLAFPVQSGGALHFELRADPPGN